MDEKRELFRHTLATLAYRTARALENAPESFADFDGAGRRPIQILAHMGDLFDWTLSMAQGKPAWHNSQPLHGTGEQQRVLGMLGDLDQFAGAPGPVAAAPDLHRREGR